MKPKFFRLPLFTFAILSGGFASQSLAVSASWTGGGSDALWSNTANWSASPVPTTGETATFNAAAGAGGAVINVSGVTILNITFDTASVAAYTIGSGAVGSQTLTLGDAANAGTISLAATVANNQTFNSAIVLGTTAVAATYNFTNLSSQTLTFNGNITGATGGTAGIKLLNLSGSGLIDISGNITKGGASQVNFSVGNSAVGNASVGSGKSLSLDNAGSGFFAVGTGGSTSGQGTLNASTSAGISINVDNVRIGVSTGSGNGNTGTLNFGLSNNITATSYFQIGGGAGSSTSNNNNGTVTTANNSNTTINTAIFRVAYGVNNGTTRGDGTFTLGTNSTLSIAGLSGGRAAMDINYGAFGNSNPNVIGTMDLSLGTADLKLSSLNIGIRTTTSSAGGGTSTGTMTLSNNSNNKLDVSGTSGSLGVVQVGHWGNAARTSTAIGTLTIGNLHADSVIESTDNGTGVLLGYRAGALGSSTGTLDLKAGSLTIKTTGAAIAGGGGTSQLYLGETSNTTLKAGASSTNWIHSLTVAEIKSGGATIDTGVYNIGISQAFSGGGTLTKSGTGTLTLGGTNTYTGATNVSAGTLLVNGALGATAVTVDTNGVIGGDGVIGGTLHFNAGADFVFNAAQTLTVNGATVTFGGFDITNLVGLDNTVAQGTYTLIDGAANVDMTNVGNVGIGSAYDLGNGVSAYFQEGSLQLVVIPEPSTALLGGLGLLALLRRRRA